MANKKISDYTEALSVADDDLLEISVDLGGGAYETRKVKKSNFGISSPLTTKGDLYTYDSADQRLPVGSDGQALIADSSEATGLRWGTVSADNMATADLTLTADRTHDLNGFVLNFEGAQVRSRHDANGYHRIFKVSDSAEEFSYLPITGGFATFGRPTGARLRIAHNGGSIQGYSNASNINYYIHPTFDNYICGDSNDLGIGLKTNPSAKVHIKSKGSTSATSALLVENSSGTDALEVRDDSVIIMANLPTSSAGLPTGAIWNNSGVINIV